MGGGDSSADPTVKAMLSKTPGDAFPGEARPPSCAGDPGDDASHTRMSARLSYAKGATAAASDDPAEVGRSAGHFRAALDKMAAPGWSGQPLELNKVRVRLACALWLAGRPADGKAVLKDVDPLTYDLHFLSLSALKSVWPGTLFCLKLCFAFNSVLP